MDTPRICITCKQEKSLDQFHTRNKHRTKNGVPFIYVYTPRECATCEHQKKNIYSHTPVGKISSKKARVKYYGSEKGQEALDAYWKSPRGKAVHKRYNKSAAGHERTERYNESDKGEVSKFIADTRIRPTASPDDPYSLTAEEWATIKASYSNRCAYCLKPLRNDVDRGHADYPTIDHIIPISRGGWTTKENVVPSCRLCNYRKHNKIRHPRHPLTKLP